MSLAPIQPQTLAPSAPDVTFISPALRAAAAVAAILISTAIAAVARVSALTGAQLAVHAAIDQECSVCAGPSCRR